MRKVVLSALLLVFVGAFAVAWLSSSTPEGSPIGDVNLAEERIPGSGTTGFGDPPRQASTSPGRSSLTAGGVGSAAGNTPESSSVPEMTIASANPQRGGYDAPNAVRRSFNGSSSFGSRTLGATSSSSGGGGGFGGAGGGGGGAGGGRGVLTSAAPRTGNEANTTQSFTADNVKTPAVTAAPRPAPSAPRPPSSGGGGDRSSAPAPGGGSYGGGGAALVPAPMVLEGPGTAATPPFGPGGSPSPAATPEPATMLLLGTGIAGLYRLRRYLE